MCWLLNGWNETQCTLWTLRLLKQAATLDIARPCRHLLVPEAAIRALQITVNSPCYNQPRVSRPKFRLETNSTVVWLYAGGVGLILPDVRFGTVSLDWVTYCITETWEVPAPCGMPDFTGSVLDTWFSKVSCWLLLVSQCSIHLSKALHKSRKIRSTCLRISIYIIDQLQQLTSAGVRRPKTVLMFIYDAVVIKMVHYKVKCNMFHYFTTGRS